MKRTRTIIVPLLVLLIAALFVSCEPTADIQGGGGDSGNKRVIKVKAEDKDLWFRLDGYIYTTPYPNSPSDYYAIQTDTGYTNNFMLEVWSTDEDGNQWTLSDLSNSQNANKIAPSAVYLVTMMYETNYKTISKEGVYQNEHVIFEIEYPVVSIWATPFGSYYWTDDNTKAPYQMTADNYKGYAQYIPEVLADLIAGEDIRWTHNGEYDYDDETDTIIIEKPDQEMEFTLIACNPDQVQLTRNPEESDTIKQSGLLGTWKRNHIDHSNMPRHSYGSIYYNGKLQYKQQNNQ